MIKPLRALKKLLQACTARSLKNILGCYRSWIIIITYIITIHMACTLLCARQNWAIRWNGHGLLWCLLQNAHGPHILGTPISQGAIWEVCSRERRWAATLPARVWNPVFKPTLLCWSCKIEGLLWCCDQASYYFESSSSREL